MVGGMSSQVYRCWCDDGSEFVLRHITDTAWLEREPRLISNEAHTLDLLATSELMAPRHIASNPEAGMLLMTLLPGETVSDSARLHSSSTQLADLATQIAAVELPHGHGLQPWRPWVNPDPAPPAWGDRSLWTEAIDWFNHTDPPELLVPSLLHRDLHPLNVLWHGTEIVGVVDWVNACVGHPHAELGHCRWNLAVLAGLDAAESFLDAYMASSTPDVYGHYWDIAPVLSFLPGPIGLTGWHAVGRTDLTPDVVIERTEQLLRSALARI